MNVANTPIYGIGLCGGALGLERGLELAMPILTGSEYRTAVVVEREADLACAMAARIEDGSLPPLAWFSDLERFDARPYRGRVGIVAAGFPCQSHSLAGKRKGTNDERWIWSDINRIIGELGPELEIVFLENVAGLLRDTGGDSGTEEPELEDTADDAIGGMGTILRDLAERGFDARWMRLRASSVGVPHRRMRVFILGFRRATTWSGRTLNAGREFEPGSGPVVHPEHPEWGTREQLRGYRESGNDGPRQAASGAGDGDAVLGDPDGCDGRKQRRSENWRRPGQVGSSSASQNMEHATPGGQGERRQPSGSAGQPDGSDTAVDDAEGISGSIQHARRRAGVKSPGRGDSLADPAIAGLEERGNSTRDCGEAPWIETAERAGVELADAGCERDEQRGSFDIPSFDIPGPGLGAAGVIDDIRELYRRSPSRAWERYQAELRNTVAWSELLVRFPWMRPAVSQAEIESTLRGRNDALADLVVNERTSALRAIGNGVVSDQAACAFITLVRSILSL